MRVSSPNSQKAAVDKEHRRAVYASETAGLLVIGLLLLVLTLVRYWHNISWSLR